MVSRTPVSRLLLLAFGLLVVAAVAGAQPAPRRARLLVSVLDQTNAVLPGAVVVLAGQDDALAAVRQEVRTSGMGVAVFDNLEPGRYTVRVEFAGFQTALVRDVRLRAGDNRRTITLGLQKHDEDVTVTRDRQSDAVDPRGSAFSTVLTREQIEALPDDPDEMEDALKAMAPPGATIRVDGFTGGRLPPKSQIRSIRLPRLDMFAAQNHGGMNGALFIDIMTMPGAGPMRGSLDFNFLDDALDARNPMTPIKGDEQLRQASFALSGTLQPNKTSFSMSASGVSQYFSSNLLAALPGGTRLAEALRQPQDRWNFNARLDHAINKDHAIRLSFDRTNLDQHNLGVGDFNLAERGYASTAATDMVRLSENGPLGRRFFTESRLQVRWSDTSFQSNEEAPTIQVNDAFTSGGAQMRGGRQDLTFEAATDLDYVRGNHSWRTGLLLEGGRYTSDDMSNYLGTYTFASLSDYEAGRPALYTRRVGDPAVKYSQVQAAAYVQDDWRVRRSLLLSAGVRYGIETHVGDAWNLSPRVSAAWSPRRNGSLTFRASYGYFYDWIATDTYKQTLLVDGSHLRELDILNPAYPDPGASGVMPPTNRYVWSGDLSLPNAQRLSVAVDRVLTQNSRLTVAFNAGFGVGLLRARNLNAPVAGVRPDPAFANVFELVPDAASRQQSLNVAWNLNKMNWHRLLLFANYTLSSNRTDTSGAFSTPAIDDNLEAEWGPSANDARHRLGAMINAQPIANLTVALNISARSALPYNVTTGRDDNGDGVFNDRPAATSRNSARGSATFDLGGRIAYGWGFGPARSAGGAGGAQVVIVSGGAGGGMAPGFGGGPSDRRFRIEFYASAQNLLNRTNFSAYSGVLASPLFGQPIGASTARRVQTGIRFSF
jgi:Carboxypeptidase regulatory-like domain